MRVLVFSVLAMVGAASFPIAEPTRSTVTRANFGCGIPPIPPIGCRVGPCVCDQRGQNCRYQFICG